MSASPSIEELKAGFLFSMKGKVAVVTGGSRGMGKEICRAFAAAGCDVLIASRKLDSCEMLAEQIRRESPGRRAVPFACNVNKWKECEALYEYALSSFGKVDVLVNNAGGSPLYPSLKDISEEYFDKIVGLNLKGPFRLAALFASKMCEGDGGCIINVSTEATIHPSPREVIYSAAKSGLNTMTKSLAHAYGPKVRVNCIMPGPFLTDISEAWDLKRQEKAWAQGSALMRAGRADEVVGAILEVTGLQNGSGARDPYHKKNLDVERDVREKMRDARLSKL
eukprot:gnl/TRDRNA2_/TRDRNA2_93746_c0_seq2.p1 gnl/TRDRNA2_/TRDRNA2_93746_c0~~gnl/TRDRNA2_/TRDRNA2_93746_c0_seq2.p1  ORF type:complete len:280 (-),score=45.67 gnl/TRDRNA2_/TRDRNA2_93746_c0_seq2:22-861(-)